MADQQSPRRLLRWQRGRQGSGYDKLLLATAPWPLAFDCYLLRYPEGSDIAAHTDPVSGRRHFRLNLVLRAGDGGQFRCRDAILNWPRIKLFRPDRSAHGVTRVTGTARYVLSIGWLWGRTPASEAPLCPTALPLAIVSELSEEQRTDPDVLAFLQGSHRADAEEKLSSPADWTPAQRDAYYQGDWKAFSRLRGYTEDEIANYDAFMQLADLLDARYGDDFSICLMHEYQQLAATPD